MFDDFELSWRDGRPRRLFVFMRQSKVWRFTTEEKSRTIGGNLYTPAPIDRSEIKQTREKPQDNITITFPYERDPDAIDPPVTQDLGNNWFPYAPQDKITVTCLDYHANDPDLETKVRWQGQVAQPQWNSKTRILQLTCVPRGSSSNNTRRGPKWQVTCWKDVYGPDCGLDPADFMINATVTAIDGLTISADEFATAPLNLAGGTFSWERDDGIVEERMIMSHSGTDIQVLYFGADLPVGAACMALPNCPGTWNDCDARGNTQRYGGAIYEPVVDPMNQSMSWQ